MSTISIPSDHSIEVCEVERSCADSGCCCSSPEGSDTRATTSRKGLMAGLLAVACTIGCFAVPFALGGIAAVSGAVAGDAWLLVGLAVAAIVIGIAVVRRRRTAKIC